MAECTFIPEQPFQPAVPSRVVTTPVNGWGEGANSVAERDGNVMVSDVMPKVIGAAWGFTQDRTSPGNYLRLTHAFLFSQNAAGLAVAQVMESGRTVGTQIVYEPLVTLFEIRRVEGRVSYWVGDERVYNSQVVSSGPLTVGAALYSTNDYIP